MLLHFASNWISSFLYSLRSERSCNTVGLLDIKVLTQSCEQRICGNVDSLPPGVSWLLWRGRCADVGFGCMSNSLMIGIRGTTVRNCQWPMWTDISVDSSNVTAYGTAWIISLYWRGCMSSVITTFLLRICHHDGTLKFCIVCSWKIQLIVQCVIASRDN